MNARWSYTECQSFVELGSPFKVRFMSLSIKMTDSRLFWSKVDEKHVRNKVAMFILKSQTLRTTSYEDTVFSLSLFLCQMNALVALCHFCELHGPRTLFCTEALHPPSPSPSSQAGIPAPGDRDREGDREGEGLTMRANSSASQRGEMCEVS